MVSCCAHVLGLRWRKNVDSGRGFGQRSSFPGWLVINCFFFVCFSSTKFSFFFFSFLKPWMERDAYLWARAEISPLFSSLLKSLLCRQGSLFVKSEPSSFASSPRLRKISGLAVTPSTPFSAATGILWFDWPINLSSFKMKGWLIPY